MLVFLHKVLAVIGIERKWREEFNTELLLPADRLLGYYYRADWNTEEVLSEMEI